MRVAIAQMEIIQGNIQENLQKIKKFVSAAKRKKADVVVFPEYCLTGSMRGKQDLAERKKKFRGIFSALAKKSGIDILAGSFVEVADGQRYNTSCYFDRNGKCCGSYRKINLWHSERPHLSRGASVNVFDTEFGKTAIAIC